MSVNNKEDVMATFSSLVLSTAWHMLHVEFSGQTILDGERYIGLEQITDEGAVGVWTKADRVTD